MTARAQNLPLTGIRVLDFAWVWSGPLVGAWLSELGAEVIKVEHGKRLDNTRLRSRPVIDGVKAEGPSIELHPYFHQLNHGKRSITLNLKEPRGQELVRQLVAKADVVLENLSPGAMARNGLGYEALAAINPLIVYLSMSALGQTGPQSGLRAYAPIMSSYAGIEAQIGYPDEPAIGMMNYGLGDPNAAAHGLVPLLAALYERETTGKGCHIDLSQIEAMLSALPEPALDALMTGDVPPPAGNRHPRMAPHGIYPASGIDRWVSIAVETDAQWQTLAGLIASPWATEPTLATLEGRLQRVADLDGKLAEWTARQERDELSQLLRAAGIPCSPVRDVSEQWASADLAERGMRRSIEHPVLGRETLYALPWSLSQTDFCFERSAPVLGEGSDEIIGGLLQLDDQEIARLREDDIIS